ncbi:MAG: response regulator, partial [Caulobacterales bacterium]|nr:response regulator [Caulobacterales bacterium]
MSGRILVVDDAEPNRRLLQARLEAEYYEVSLACDGLECLDAVAAEPPDLILLDVMMPNLDGF